MRWVFAWPFDGMKCYLLDTLGEKVVHFHTHDIHGVRRADLRDQCALGDLDANGVIDFPSVLSWVDQSRYAGLWSLELEEPDREPALARSRDYLASLRPQLARR